MWAALLLVSLATAPPSTSTATATATTPATTPATPATAIPAVVEAVRDRDDVPGVRAAFDVAAAPDDLLQLLWDVSKFKQIFPDIKELIVEGRPDENTVVVRFVVDAAVAQVTYTLRRVVDRSARTVSWVSVAGDLKKIVGFWRVSENGDGGSHVVYQSVVDVGFVPGATSVYRSVVLSKMGSVVDHVRAAARTLPAPAPAPAPAPR